MGAAEHIAKVFEHDPAFLRTYYEKAAEQKARELLEAALRPTSLTIRKSMSRGDVSFMCDWTMKKKHCFNAYLSEQAFVPPQHDVLLPYVRRFGEKEIFFAEVCEVRLILCLSLL
jgi:hypothetical protein